MKRQPFKAISSDNAVAAIQAREFLTRHGGPGTEDPRHGESEDDRSGWWEISAADGYKLRCDWLRSADEERLTSPRLRLSPRLSVYFSAAALKGAAEATRDAGRHSSMGADSGPRRGATRADHGART